MNNRSNKNYSNVNSNGTQVCNHNLKFNQKEHVYNGIQHLRTVQKCKLCSFRKELNTWLPINKDNTFGRTYGKLV